MRPRSRARGPCTSGTMPALSLTRPRDDLRVWEDAAMTPDPALAADIDACCRLTGTFTLRSGQVADTYFDKYLFESDPALLDRVATQMVELLPDDTELLGGLEMGGIPCATVVSAKTGLPALFVRKSAKQYGTA